MPASDVALTATWAVIPPTGGGGGGSGGTALTTTANPDSSVIIEGKNGSIGKVETTANDVTVVVDQEKLNNKIAAAKEGSSVVVPVSNTKTSASAQLVVKSVQEMAGKNMTLEVQAGGVTSVLPTTPIDVTALLQQLDAKDAAKVPFTVTITGEAGSKVEGATVIGSPTRFAITASYNGKTVNVDHFDAMEARLTTQGWDGPTGLTLLFCRFACVMNAQAVQWRYIDFEKRGNP